MTDFYFYLLVGTSCVGLVWGALKPGRIFELPPVVSVVMIAFIVPQARIIINNDGLVPDDAFAVGVSYTIACLAAIYSGYFSNPTVNRPKPVTLDVERLFQLGRILIIIGTLARILQNLYLGGLFALYSESGAYAIEWRGAVVYFSFAAQFGLPGLVLVFVSHLVKPRPDKVLWLGIGIVYPLAQVVFLGRRFQTAWFVVMAGMCLHYFRGWSPNRLSLVLAVPIALAVFVLLPAVRGYLQYDDPNRSKVLETDVVAVFDDFLQPEELTTARGRDLGVYEYRYALLTIASVGINDVALGTGIWDKLVHQFVPRGLVGAEVKEGLKVNWDASAERVFEKYGVVIPGYVTSTGFGSSFLEFWYFGIAGFYFAGRWFKRLVVRARRFVDPGPRLTIVLFGLVPALIVYQSWQGLIVQTLILGGVVWLTKRYAEKPAPASRGQFSCVYRPD